MRISWLRLVRVEHGDLAAGLERDEEVDAQRVEGGGAGHAGVVVVDARPPGPRDWLDTSMRELMARTVFWKLSTRPSRARRAAGCPACSARRPACRRARSPSRPGSSGSRGPGSRRRACRCGPARSCAARLIARRHVDDDHLAAHRLAIQPWSATLAVASPGSGGVMKRDTKAVAPSAATATWRGFAPTAGTAPAANRWRRRS